MRVFGPLFLGCCAFLSVFFTPEQIVNYTNQWNSTNYVYTSKGESFTRLDVAKTQSLKSPTPRLPYLDEEDSSFPKSETHLESSQSPVAFEDFLNTGLVSIGLSVVLASVLLKSKFLDCWNRKGSKRKFFDFLSNNLSETEFKDNPLMAEITALRTQLNESHRREAALKVRFKNYGQEFLQSLSGKIQIYKDKMKETEEQLNNLRNDLKQKDEEIKQKDEELRRRTDEMMRKLQENERLRHELELTKKAAFEINKINEEIQNGREQQGKNLKENKKEEPVITTEEIKSEETAALKVNRNRVRGWTAKPAGSDHTLSPKQPKCKRALYQELEESNQDTDSVNNNPLRDLDSLDDTIIYSSSGSDSESDRSSIGASSESDSPMSSPSKESFLKSPKHKSIVNRAFSSPEKTDFKNRAKEKGRRGKSRATEKLFAAHTCSLTDAFNEVCPGCLDASPKEKTFNRQSSFSSLPLSPSKSNILNSPGKALVRSQTSLGTSVGKSDWNDPNLLPPTPIQILALQGQIKIGIRLEYKDKPGTVKFFGKTDLGPGDWIGLELDTKNGEHDGEVRGKRYFSTQEGHAILIEVSSPKLTLPKLVYDTRKF